MNAVILLSLVVYEVISIALIYRLWTGKRRPGVVERCLLSAVLLVPVAGWVLYLFLKATPGEHGEELPEESDAGGPGHGIDGNH